MEDEDLRAAVPDLPADHGGGRLSERWVLITVHEAYIHCRKHIPRMVPAPRHRCRGTDNVTRKGGDYFDAKSTPRHDESANTTVDVQRSATPAESTIRDATADAGDH